MKKVKQYGLQRSGTNYTRFLLISNYQVDVLVNQGGWKHGFIDDKFERIVVTVKNPYSWLISTFNYFCKNRKDYTISDYIKGPFNFEFVHSHSPVIHWCSMNRHWIDEICGDLYVVKYEDMLSSPKSTCEKIASAFSLSSKGDFYVPQNIIHANTHEDKEKKFNFDFYKNQEYLNVLSEEDLEAINSALDAELMAELGYELMDG